MPEFLSQIPAAGRRIWKTTLPVRKDYLRFIRDCALASGYRRPAIPAYDPLCSVKMATSGRLNSRNVGPELPSPRVTNRAEPFSS